MKNSEYLFVPYDLAVKLKEKGFNENCFGYHNIAYGDDSLAFSRGGGHINTSDKIFPSAPIFEQVINWFDEVHKIRICLGTAKTSGKYRYDIIQFIEGKWQGDYNLSSFYTRTERNIKAINEALELIEKKN